MLPFAIAIFLGALLMFLVQPLLGKALLPWFGGSSAVWTTCLLFFQAALLGAYAYAHALARLASLRRQALVHAGLIGLAVGQLALQAWAWPAPLLAGAGLRPEPGGAPTWHLLGLLGLSVGLPILAIGATSPLVQAWFHSARPGRSPYRLYSLSNLGSLAGLLCYPFLLEPLLGLEAQGWLWTGGLGLYALALGVCLWVTLRAAPGRRPDAPEVDRPEAPPSAGRVALWLGLPAAASLVLAAGTAQMTQEVAASPFLWVLPLGLYLLSFVLTFSGSERMPRLPRLLALAICLALAVVLLWKGGRAGIGAQLAVWSACVFLCGLACHGELYRLRPEPGRLTAYYLCLSAGGVLGGAFAALVAPLMFRGFFELHLGLVLVAGLVWAALWADRGSWFHGPGGRRVMLGSALGVLGLAAALGLQAQRWDRDALEASRDFYGVLRVRALDRDDPDLHRLDLYHGIIRHGSQLQAAGLRREPTTYYGPESGAGLALEHHPRRARGEPLRVGLVGLGVGTLAVYGQAGDMFRFYELHPRVAELARGAGGHFDFLQNATCAWEIVLGDARLSLERELGEAPAGYHLLLVDAFSSDAIPTHLLTREALGLYLAHLAPGGVLGLHITNRHLDLEPVVRALGKERGLRVERVDAPGEPPVTLFSRWMLLGGSPEFWREPAIAEALAREEPPTRGLRPWTDDFSNLLEVLR
jgi:hypothetical protein